MAVCKMNIAAMILCCIDPFIFYFNLMNMKLITASIFWMTAMFYWPYDLDMIFVAGIFL